MSKKAFTAIIIISVFLISLVAGLQVVEVAKANFAPTPAYPPSILIVNPQTLALCKGNIELTFNETHERIVYDAVISKVWFNYTIDNYQPVMIEPILVSSVNDRDILSNQWSINISTYGLVNGLHRIFVTGKIGEAISKGWNGDFGGAIGTSHTIYFNIENIIPDNVIISPTNKTYATTEIPLILKTTTTALFSYSLDNQANTIITGNTTLTGLSNGSHSLTVYAKDTAGNLGKSDTTFFSINIQLSPTPSPAPTTNITPTLTALPSPTITTSPTKIIQIPLSSPSISSSNSLTQKPTLSHSPTLDNIQAENYTSTIIILSLATIAVAVGVIVYFKKIKKKNEKD